MTTVVLVAAAAMYLLSAMGYGAAFVRPALAKTARVAFALAAAAFVVHGVAIGVGCGETGGRHLLTVGGAAGLVGSIAAGVFLGGQRAFGTPAAGVFALPLVLVSTLPGIFAPRIDGRDVATALATVPAVRVHVTTSAAGVALFALACAVAVMYLLQARELKEKRFGPLLSRLPSLHAIDRVNGWLVAAGFAVFTPALVSGTLLARGAWCSTWEWDGQQVASLATWLLFGTIALARRAGSRGRRHAVLTIAAFSIGMTSLVGVRQVRATRHAAFDTAPVVACADPR